MTPEQRERVEAELTPEEGEALASLSRALGVPSWADDPTLETAARHAAGLRIAAKKIQDGAAGTQALADASIAVGYASGRLYDRLWNLNRSARWLAEQREEDAA